MYDHDSSRSKTYICIQSGLGYGTAISPERTIMDDFLTKYLDGPIKQVYTNYRMVFTDTELISSRPYCILRLLLNIVSYFIFSCRKISRSNQRQIKRSKKGGQTMVIRTVQTVHSRLHKCPLDSD